MRSLRMELSLPDYTTAVDERRWVAELARAIEGYLKGCEQMRHVPAARVPLLAASHREDEADRRLGWAWLEDDAGAREAIGVNAEAPAAMCASVEAEVWGWEREDAAAEEAEGSDASPSPGPDADARPEPVETEAEVEAEAEPLPEAVEAAPVEDERDAVSPETSETPGAPEPVEAVAPAAAMGIPGEMAEAPKVPPSWRNDLSSRPVVESPDDLPLRVGRWALFLQHVSGNPVVSVASVDGIGDDRFRWQARGKSKSPGTAPRSAIHGVFDTEHEAEAARAEIRARVERVWAEKGGRIAGNAAGRVERLKALAEMKAGQLARARGDASVEGEGEDAGTETEETAPARAKLGFAHAQTAAVEVEPAEGAPEAPESAPAPAASPEPEDRHAPAAPARPDKDAVLDAIARAIEGGKVSPDGARRPSGLQAIPPNRPLRAKDPSHGAVGKAVLFYDEARGLRAAEVVEWPASGGRFRFRDGNAVGKGHKQNVRAVFETLPEALAAKQRIDRAEDAARARRDDPKKARQDALASLLAV